MIGLISGVTAAGAWRTWLLFINQVPFGVKDPQFHLDLSFFVFTYPFIRLVLSYLFAAVLLSLVAGRRSCTTCTAGCGCRPGGPGRPGPPRPTCSCCSASSCCSRPSRTGWTGTGIDFSQRGAVTTGASYTDVNAVLPAKTVLAVIAIICALLFFAGAIRRSPMLPAVGFGLLVLSAILIGGLYPAIIQQFVVKPNELAKETPYIQREIDSTRQAYGITYGHGQRARVHRRTADTSSSVAGQRASAGLPGVRLLDPDVVSPTFQQLQQDQGLLPVPQRAVGGPVPAARRWPAAAGHWWSRCAACPGRRPARATGSTPTWSTRTASACRGRRGTRVQSDGNPSFVESEIPPHRASSRCASRGCTSARGRTPTRSSAARPGGHRGTRLPVRTPAASRTTPTVAVAASASARR